MPIFVTIYKIRMTFHKLKKLMENKLRKTHLKTLSYRKFKRLLKELMML